MDELENSRGSQSQIIIYQAENGRTKIEVTLEDETVWLTQKRMAELFQVGVNTINYHIKEIYKEGELAPESTIRKFRIVQKEGQREVTRSVDFYKLDLILSVGYRVRSHVATRFRQWASQRLREYIIKGRAGICIITRRRQVQRGPGRPCGRGRACHCHQHHRCDRERTCCTLHHAASLNASATADGRLVGKPVAENSHVCELLVVLGVSIGVDDVHRPIVSIHHAAAAAVLAHRPRGTVVVEAHCARAL